MVPGIVFMRGGAVAVLVILECEGVKYTILTRQARVPIGTSDLPEIPAGMLDDSQYLRGVAADELKEECGIELGPTDLISLTTLAFGAQGWALLALPQGPCARTPSVGSRAAREGQ